MTVASPPKHRKTAAYSGRVERESPLEENTALFFASDRLHEVTPVELLAEDVLCSRLVLNGWFHGLEG